MKSKFTPRRQDYTRSMTRQEVPSDAPKGTEVWFSDDARGYTAVCFTGKADKPTIHTRYMTADSRLRAVNGFIEMITENAARKAEQRQARKNAEFTLKPGDILSGSWGYDQTNVEFFQIVAVSGRKVTIQELGHVSVPGTQGFDCESVMPGKPYGPKIVKIAQTSSGKDWYVKLNDYCTLHLWDGSKRSKSWYA